MKSCWIIGDVNLDAMKWNSPDYDHEDMVELVKTDIETENFQQLIENPTRFWPNQPSSLLDQVWTNNIAKIIEVKNMDRAASDHNPIMIKIRIKGVDNKPTEVLVKK